ncbi:MULTISPECIES: biotin/lipoyl-binding protein [unclassified Chamaesiphon]|uniref:biotin/lipoyl-binding protein n=1 Tax=unclassified Chamaesiphon TaxID=2620921 RepID=UPI00286D03D7|nr:MULTISPECIES: biotin/lipoyl-binding protein [unclassified Chamaesiphon]
MSQYYAYELSITDRQKVQPGQLLFRLDPKDSENKVQQAQFTIEIQMYRSSYLTCS